MPKGSNDLNMLLKAKVVKLRAELDLKESMPKIRAQVDTITKRLANKPVKLKVKLDATIGALNKQINALTTRLQSSRTAKPIKLRVAIDVAGSAKNIQAQLNSIHKTFDNFNKKYGQQIAKMQNHSRKIKNIQSMPIGSSANVNKSIGDMKRYASELKKIEAMMRKGAPKGGLFASHQLKDARGNVQALIGTLEHANGVVDKVRYNFNKSKGAFEIVDRSTMTKTQKHVSQAVKSLKGLEKELDKAGDSSRKFRAEYERMMQAGSEGRLTKDAVADFDRRIKAQQSSIQMAKKENDLYREREKILRQLDTIYTKSSRKSKMGEEIRQMRAELKAIPEDAFKFGKAEEKLKQIKHRYGEIKAEQTKQIADSQKIISLKEKERSLNERIASVQHRYGVQRSGALSETYARETEQLSKKLQKTKDVTRAQSLYNEVLRRTKAMESAGRELTRLAQTERALERLRTAMLNYQKVSHSSLDTVNRRFETMSSQIKKGVIGMNDLTRATELYNTRTRKQTDANLASMNSKRLDYGTMQSIISSGDVNRMKEYVGHAHNAQIETAKIVTNGKGVSRVTAQFQGTGKTVRQMTYEMDRANKSVRVVNDGLAYNRRENLGMMEQMRIAMSRVPIWMGAMTVFYGSIRSVRAMSREIMELDRVMTEFRRVASDKLNLEVAFQGAIQLAKQLGNDVHGVTQTMADMARTYGDFNERQLLALTKTATLMSNVSDMEVEHAAETLIATSNAFGIVADETMRIVDVVNEVDNNYSVSTQQLAEGLQRSANTARTFGVTLEENVGHITAISSVTMESGRIIGNSLKTIYSRITTMKPAEDILKSVGVSIREIGENGQEHVRPVTSILNDLSEVWWDLTDAQRQNIGVTLAGRHQLGRFLGMMNNYDIALDATKTAVTSHGSAMKENAEYLKSFEARINILKVAFTEFSQAVGNAFMSDAIMLLANDLTKLADGAVKVIEKVGALPPLLFGLSLVMGKMGVFNRWTSMLSAIPAMVTRISTAFMGAKRHGASMTQSVTAGLKSVDRASKTATGGMQALGLSLKTLAVSTGIGLVLAGIGMAVEKLMRKRQEQLEQERELEEMNRTMIESYRNHSDGMVGIISRYDELSKKQNLSIDEQQELAEITSELANGIPTAVKYVDASGEAHMKTTEEIIKHVDAVRQLSEAEARETIAKFNRDILNRSHSYKELNKEIAETKKRVEELNAEIERGSFRELGSPIEEGLRTSLEGVGSGALQGIDKAGILPLLDGIINRRRTEESLTKEIELTQIEIIKLEAEKTEHLQQDLILIQEQAIAYFDARGELGKMGDAQVSVMEQAISANEAVLRDAGNKSEELYQQTFVALLNHGREVGNIFTETYDILESRAGDDPLKLDRIPEQLNAISNALPEDLFEFDGTRTQEQMQNIIKEVANVQTHIEAGSQDFKGLQQRLEDIGLTSQEAGKAIHLISLDAGNAGLEMQAWADDTYDAKEALDELSGAMLETIDIQAEFTGYSGEELAGIKNHIDMLKQLHDVYGEGATEKQVYVDTIGDVAEALGVSTQYVEKNMDTILEMIDLIGEIDWSEPLSKQLEDIEGFSQKSIDLLRELDSKDLLTGEAIERFGGTIEVQTEKVNDLYAITKEGADNTKKSIHELRQEADNPFGLVNLINVGKETEQVDNKLSHANKTFNNFREGLGSDLPTSGITNVKNEISGVGEEFESQASIIELTAGTMFEGMDFTYASDSIKLMIEQTVIDMDTMSEKVSEVEGAFEKLGQKTGGAGVISGNIVGLRNKMEEALKMAEKLAKIMSELGRDTALDSSINAIKEMGKASQDAKSNFENLEKAIAGSNIDSSLTGNSRKISEMVASMRKAQAQAIILTQAIMRIRVTVGVINQVAIAFGKLGTGLMKATRDVDSAIARQINSLQNLKRAYGEAQVFIWKVFDHLKSGIVNNSATMIQAHHGHITKINELAQSARRARSDIISLNATMGHSIGAMGRYVTRANNLITQANRARSATASVSGTAGMLMGLSYNEYNVFDGESSESSGAIVSAMSGIQNSLSGAFSASTGETSGGVSSGGGGTSGTLTTSVNLTGEPSFMAFKRDELYKVSNRQRNIENTSGNLRELETRMNRITKATLSYRNALAQSVQYYNTLLKLNKQDLNATIRRNKSIDNQLRKLRNTSRHSEKERQKYNKLQQEYDSNLSKISSLKSEIQSTMNSIKEKSLEIFTDFVDQIINRYDNAIKTIDNRIENLDFTISVTEYVDPENTKKILNAQIDRAHQLQIKQATAQNKVNTLQREYNKLQKKSSKEGKYIKEQLDDANKDLRDITLAVLSAEKDVKDARANVADESIKMLKDYYNNMKSMAISAIDAEIKASRDALDEKIKNYDEEIKKINEVYDAKVKEINKEKAEDDYQEELHKKNMKRADLIKRITLLSKDNSLDGKKRLAELEADLTETNEDIAKFQADRQRELLLESIETQKEAHLKGIEDRKEADQAEHERYIEQLETEKEAVEKKYDDLINNERRWAEIREEFIKGSFDMLLDELEEMNVVLDDMGKGIYDGLTDSFNTFSDVVKAQVKEMNKITVDNMKLISETVTKNAKAIADAKKLTESKGKTTSTAKAKAPKVTTPKKTTKSTSSSKSSGSSSSSSKKSTSKSKAVKVGGKVKVSAKNANAYMDSYGRQVKPWAQQAKAAGVKYGQSLYAVNQRSDYVALGKTKSVNSAIAWVKKKDLVGLRTGGMTPDWQGDDGRLALLHKKELVLNKGQTRDYLSFAKVMDSVIANMTRIERRRSFNPEQIKGSITNSTATVKYGDITFQINDADKKTADKLVKEIMKEFDKRGG